MNNNRRLVVVTDGQMVNVETCEISALEVKTVLDVLLDALMRGQFPWPGGKPVMLQVCKNTAETKADECDSIPIKGEL